MGVTALVGVATAAFQMNEQKKAAEEAAKVEQEQINDVAASEMEDRIRAAREARATARAASAEAGVAGASVDALINDAFMQSGRDVSRIEKNRQNGVASSDAEAAARIRDSNAQGISTIANTAVNFYGDYSKLKVQ